MVILKEFIIMKVDEDFTCGRVGPPLQCCDIKLVAWEEGYCYILFNMNWFSK